MEASGYFGNLVIWLWLLYIVYRLRVSQRKHRNCTYYHPQLFYDLQIPRQMFNTSVYWAGEAWLCPWTHIHLTCLALQPGLTCPGGLSGDTSGLLLPSHLLYLGHWQESHLWSLAHLSPQSISGPLTTMTVGKALPLLSNFPIWTMRQWCPFKCPWDDGSAASCLTEWCKYGHVPQERVWRHNFGTWHT